MYLEETEQEIIKAVLVGDRRAMRNLYERFSGRATAVAMRYVADNEAVKDVLQESFVKVFMQIRRFNFRGEGSLCAWIMRIVINESLNYLRQRRKFHFLLTEDRKELEMVAVDENPPDLDSISDERLYQLIATLPDGYRTVLNLFVFEKMSHQEIAQLLGIRATTSASQFMRAKRMLAKMIKNEQKQDRR